MSVSSLMLLIATATEVYLESAGLGDIGDLTYLDFYWLVFDVIHEINVLMDQNCYWPTFFPLSIFTPDHCNPYRLVEETAVGLKRGPGKLNDGVLTAEFRAVTNTETANDTEHQGQSD